MSRWLSIGGSVDGGGDKFAFQGFVFGCHAKPAHVKIAELVAAAMDFIDRRRSLAELMFSSEWGFHMGKNMYDLVKSYRDSCVVYHNKNTICVLNA